MKATFTFLIAKGVSTRERLINLFYNEDFHKYIQEMMGTEMHMEIKPTAKTAEKLRMYAYYNGPLLDCAIEAFTSAGWELMDEEKADYLLKKYCASATMVGPDGKEETYVLEKSGMTKKRLHKFISDALFFLESELSQKVPDAERWKMQKETGRSFTSVKFNDELGKE